MNKTLLLLPLLSFALTSLSSAAIVTPGLLSAVNTNTDTGIGSGNAQLTDNSGLSAPVSPGDSLASALVVTHVLNGPGYQQSWVTTGVAGDYFGSRPVPVFTWDVGSDLPLSDLVVWVYGNDGGSSTSRGNQAQTLELRFNTDAQGSAAFAGAATTLTLAPDTTTGGTSLPQALGLGGVTARYVEMRVTDNYFGTAPMTAGGDRVGIGEIRFNTVPEPSTGVLALAGALLLRRRRR